MRDPQVGDLLEYITYQPRPWKRYIITEVYNNQAEVTPVYLLLGKMLGKMVNERGEITEFRAIDLMFMDRVDMWEE